MSNLVRQHDLEDRMVKKGEARFKRAWNKSKRGGYLEDNQGVLRLVDGVLAAYADEVCRWFEKKERGEAGRGSHVVLRVQEVDPAAAAFIAAKYIIAALCSEQSVTACAAQIGAAIEGEAFMAVAQREDPAMIKTVNGQIQARNITSKGRKRGYHKRVGKLRKILFDSWTTAQRVQVGEIMIDLFQQACRDGDKALFEVSTWKVGKRTMRTFRCSPHLADALFFEALDGVATPWLLPMLVKPVSWAATRGKGGYITQRFDFVKPFLGAPAEFVRDRQLFYKANDFTNSWKAVDAVQSTPFKINTQILDVMFALSKRDKGLHFVEEFEPVEVPPHVEGLEGDALTELKRSIRDAHDENSKRVQKRLSLARALKVAQMFREEDAIYFPHNVDFRGRMYPIPAGLQPQGPDEIRGLLLFSEGKHPGEEGMRWLHINLANLWGEDKLSYDDRVHWTKANMDKIKRYAEDPLRFPEWQDADKPFQFLAACIDFVGVLEGHPSFVRVGMDGSCNGLQHLSALLRDEVGAKSVNLVDSDKPNDIYADVAEVVKEMLKTPDPDRKAWAEVFRSFKIDRKVTKRSVMVMPYGGKMESTINYVADELKPLLKEHNPFGEERFKATAYLGTLVFHATREVIKGGAVAMEWLQSVARETSKVSPSLTWITPNGFPVYQCYLDQKAVQVVTHLEGTGRIRKTQINEKLAKGKRGKMVDSVSPNFVHSLDACHLMMTVSHLKGYGVTSFQVIHDDYGTHAADAQAMYHSIRMKFFEMYELHKPLEDLKARVELLYEIEVPDVPKSGKWNPTQVLGAEHFFG